MSAIMSSTAKIFFVYGVPLAAPTHSGAKISPLLKNLSDEEGEEFSKTESPIALKKTGLLSVSDVDDDIHVFGVVLSSTDLHKNCHHTELDSLPLKPTAQQKSSYRTALAKLPASVQSVVKKAKGQPRVFMVVDVRG